MERPKTERRELIESVGLALAGLAAVVLLLATKRPPRVKREWHITVREVER